MGKATKTRKFAAVKRILNPKDSRVQNGNTHPEKETKKKNPDAVERRQVDKPDSSMFFEYNKNLVPPYQVLVDTNFLNFSIQHKMDVMQGMMDCLTAKCIPMVTDCVIGELEKGRRSHALALKLAKDPRFQRLKCTHKGTYADDCLTERVTQNKCFIVATNDKDLRRRIRKIPGVPIMYVANHKYAIERMPETLTDVRVNKK